MDLARPQEAPGSTAPRDARLERQQVLGAVKFMGLTPPAPAEASPSWTARVLALLSRATRRHRAARPG